MQKQKLNKDFHHLHSNLHQKRSKNKKPESSPLNLTKLSLKPNNLSRLYVYIKNSNRFFGEKDHLLN